MKIRRKVNSDKNRYNERVAALIATARKAAEDARIYAIYPELDPKLLDEYPILGKDLSSTHLFLKDIVALALSIDIKRAFVLMNMRPADIDMHPELLYSHLDIKDIAKIRGQKSLGGQALQMLGIQQVVERQISEVIPEPTRKKKSFWDRWRSTNQQDFRGGGDED